MLRVWATLNTSIIITADIVYHIYLIYIYTHTRLTALFPGLPRLAGTRKVKPIWILLKQETVSGSGISWAICKSAPCSRQITTPSPHHSVFLQAGWPSCRPTNSIKALSCVRSLRARLHWLDSIQVTNANANVTMWYKNEQSHQIIYE